MASGASCFSEPITIRHLLNHTSGLRDYSALQEVARRLEQIDNLGVLPALCLPNQSAFALSFRSTPLISTSLGGFSSGFGSLEE